MSMTEQFNVQPAPQRKVLGIEFGSTRIKAVLIDPENHPIAQGSHTWENQLVDGLWTYSIEEIWYGLQDCYADLRANVKKQYDTEIETLAAIGVSAMMHGYMAFDKMKRFWFLSVPGETPTPGKPLQLYPSFLSTTSLSDGASLIYIRPY